MTVTAADREIVRRRARSACEYCGVTETETGAQLTIDHFRPTSQGGGNGHDNLIYCCARCNEYKHDYWPIGDHAPRLWNPREETSDKHFVELEDGRLHSLSPVGAFTIQCLRLNRPPLVAHRSGRRQRGEEARLLAQYQHLLRILGDLLEQQSDLIGQQHRLLEEQRNLLRLLLPGRKE